MNKISDLKVGDQVVTNNFGRATVISIGLENVILAHIEKMPFRTSFF